LSAAEPDKAAVTCDCTPTPGEVQATAFDEAKFQCLTPGLAVTKVCKVQAADGTNEVDVTLMNTGTADLQNCVVTDKVFPNDPTCPPTGAGTPVATTPATIASLDPGATASATGSVSGLTANACDEVSVTCDVVGATGQTVTGTDEQVCVAAPPPPSGCRVTGGGLVDACGPDLPGGDAPEHCGDRNSDALNATHGGQVGAPVGVATAFTPDSVCIQGEWQHVRHIRPKLYGNFH